MRTLFELNDIVKHLKSGNVYEIVEIPKWNDVLEENMEPFYKYYEKGKVAGIYFNRCKSQMEDGRFIKIENPFD